MNRALLTLAAVSLGAALQVRDGLYSPLAIALLALACVAVGSCLVMPNPSPLPSPRVRGEGVERLLVVALIIQLVLLLAAFPGAHYQPHSPREYWPFLACVAVAGGITLSVWWIPSRVAIGSFLAVYLAAGAWVIRFTPSPRMDVYTFQRDACVSILHGVNPYAITYPNVNGPDGAWVYGPGLVKDGRLLFGFPYMPLTLWWDLLGHSVGGDYRWANLAAVAIGAVSIAALGWTRASVLAGALLLFTPRGFYIIEQGWTEPLSVMLLAATVLSAARGSATTPYLFGLLLASKQYAVIIVPLAFLLPQRVDLRFVLKALGSALVMTLPLVVWNPHAFWDSAVALQFKQPFRTDSLSVAALVTNLGWGRPPELLSIAVALVVIIICYWRCERSAGGFAFAVAATSLAFFATNKQAFGNYYFFVIAAICSALGAGFTPARSNVR